MIRIRSRSPLVGLALRRSRGYRQLCSLWFEYDLCLNRKPPNDLETFLTTLIRIRSKSEPKGVKLDSNTISPQWSFEAGYLCLSCALQQILFGPFNFSENSNLWVMNSSWTRRWAGYWKLQRFVGDRFPLSRIKNQHSSFWDGNFLMAFRFSSI